MPTLNVAGLITAYVVIAVLLLSINLYSRWSWWAKVVTNVIVAGFFWVTYTSYPEILGWPTKHDLPKRFYLHAVAIDEPNWVYLWGTDLDQGLGQPIPRSFGVPYTKSLHDRVDKAKRKLRKGLPMIGQVNQASGSIGEISETVPSQIKVVDIQFVDAPQALVPGKN